MLCGNSLTLLATARVGFLIKGGWASFAVDIKVTGIVRPSVNVCMAFGGCSSGNFTSWLERSQPA
jgi:hypothetical protein